MLQFFHLAPMGHDDRGALGIDFVQSASRASSRSSHSRPSRRALEPPRRARFVLLLLRLVAVDGGMRAPQTELTALAGMNRAAFRRARSGLIDAGIVKAHRRVVRFLGLAALEKEADISRCPRLDSARGGHVAASKPIAPRRDSNATAT